MIQISRVYQVDGADTCILAESDNAQSALRMVEAAAEQIGAAPQSAAPVKGKPGRPKKEDKSAEPAPALPPGVSAVFPSGDQPAPAQAAHAPVQAPPMMAPAAEFVSVPPVPVGQTQVGFAPPPESLPPGAPPTAPVFAPPPPPEMTPIERARATLQQVAEGVATMMTDPRAPAHWKPAVEQQVHGLIGHLTPASTEADVTTAIGHLRSYEATVRTALGI